MENTTDIKSIYKKIQKKLFYMIPEKWESIYLYAAISEKLKKIEIGEMFFYYYPRAVIKKKPINVYEVANKFNIDEDEYSVLINELYNEIKNLRTEFRKNSLRVWTNITIKIENNKFIVEYFYNNLSESRYTEKERHLIWKYKNLNYPLEKFNKRERKALMQYLKEDVIENEGDNIYQEMLYKIPKSNIIEYNREISKVEVPNLKETKIKKQEIYKKIDNKKSESPEERVITKSQILKI
ncbi:MAG: DUF600 family protein [Clostridia bacterium]|nr:DUF600 family protein [Clostridia bacterium]